MADDTFYFTLSQKWQMTLSISPESQMADDTFYFTLSHKWQMTLSISH